MKMKRTIIMILICAMVLPLFATSCGPRTLPQESEPSEIEKPDATTSVPTSEPEIEQTTEDPAPKPPEDHQDDVETVEANTNDTAAEPGVWIATKKLGNDSVLGDLRFRVTTVLTDQEAILAAIDAYNKDDDNFRKVDTDFPENFTLRLCEYEVVYNKDYPGYGENGSTIYSPDLYFNIAAEGGGGLDTADGLTYIGLNCIDISKKVTSVEAGELFKGVVIYAIPNNAIEQYYLAYYYSTKDAEGNYMSIYSYVIPEVIKGK